MEYISKSQLARVSTESWIARHGYCLACPSDRLSPTRANTFARDFECPACGHPYELKSTSKPFGRKVVDGAYAPMMRRIEEGTVPSFFLLRYQDSGPVTDLSVINRSLITNAVVEKRKPLSDTARRAGWTGCNLLLKQIPPEGFIPLLVHSVATPREVSRAVFGAAEKLRNKTLESRSWSRSILSCVHRLPGREFTLAQVYSFEDELSLQYPENKNIRPKIRQQLQVLRDAGLLIFECRGAYRLRYASGPIAMEFQEQSSR